MKWRWWRTADEMAADFAASRSREADGEFVTHCGLPDTPLARRVALAVRRSVARYGMIESDFIRASDAYPDQLIELSGWDSLDQMEWVLELERKLDIPIRDDTFVNLRQRFTVADLAHAVYAFVEQQVGQDSGQS